MPYILEYNQKKTIFFVVIHQRFMYNSIFSKMKRSEWQGRIFHNTAEVMAIKEYVQKICLSLMISKNY